MLLIFVVQILWTGVLCRRGAVVLKPHREVRTTQGVVRGYLQPHPPHFAFLGLPYARPPTHHYRFKGPLPPQRWDGIFEAQHWIRCPQAGGGVDENCLVVNVFVQQHADSAPVLVLVHNGELSTGWGSFQAPPQFLKKGYVVITFNYRLGALGFLCLGTEGAPGNAGLKDLMGVLYWVHRNIASFGGDPKNVILYGTESGAVLTELILLSGVAKDLFHKVILENGSSLSPSFMSYNPIEQAFKAAKILGYNGTDDAEKLTRFYKLLSVKSLLRISNMFLPCVESPYLNSIIDEDPMHLLKQFDGSQVPVLVIYVKNDNNLIVRLNPEKFSVVPDIFDDFLPNNLMFKSGSVHRRIAETVKTFYFEDNFIVRQIMQNYEDYVSHVFTEYPIAKSATLLAARSTKPVFLMEFGINKEAESMETTNYDHNHILRYFFNKLDMSEDFESYLTKDHKITEILLSLWHNFIALDDPTPIATQLVPEVWQPVVRRTSDHINFDQVNCLIFRDSIKMGAPTSSQALTLWDHIYSNFYRHFSFFDNQEDVDYK